MRVMCDVWWSSPFASFEYKGTRREYLLHPLTLVAVAYHSHVWCMPSRRCCVTASLMDRLPSNKCGPPAHSKPLDISWKCEFHRFSRFFSFSQGIESTSCKYSEFKYICSVTQTLSIECFVSRVCKSKFFPMLLRRGTLCCLLCR